MRVEVWRGATGQRGHGGVVQCAVSVGDVGCESWVCIQREMLISGNSMSIEELSSPCITCLLVFFTGGTKSINDLISGSNAKGRGRIVRMRSRGSVGQIEKNVSSSDKF